MDIIKLILDPPQALCPSEDQWLIPLNMALVLNEIWHLRNQVSFQEGQVDIPNSIKQINFKFLEFSTLLESKKPSSAAPVVFRWEPPPPGWIKLNVDAAVAKSSFALTIVARDDKGIVSKAWSKTHHPCPPIVAEANAILWVAQLAIQERWSHIIIEGDAKRCFDPLSFEDVILDQSIANLVCSILNLKVGFVQCCFRWVKRESNSAAHVTAKFSLSSSESFCFNKDNIPRVVHFACLGDCLSTLSI